MVLHPENLSLQRKSDMLSRLISTAFMAGRAVIMKCFYLIFNKRQSHDKRPKSKRSNEIHKLSNELQERSNEKQGPSILHLPSEALGDISSNPPVVSHENRPNSKQSNEIRERSNKKQGLSILDLPSEMLGEIFSHLQVVSQASLALSCKRLYLLLGPVLKDPAFEYPYSDGLDERDLSNRTKLLIALESKRWKYCAACLKLHPLDDFDHTSLGYENPNLRACRWPGIIVLCPCLKIRAKRFDGLNSQYVPIWHRCSYSSLSEGVSYDLKISLSVKSCGKFVFNFQYLVRVDSADFYRARRRMMLCPHKDALRQIKLNNAGCVGSGVMDCQQCGIFPDTLLSDDSKTYDIQFTREFYFRSFTWTKPPFTTRTADYNWRRYNIFLRLLAQIMFTNINPGVSSLFWQTNPSNLHSFSSLRISLQSDGIA